MKKIIALLAVVMVAACSSNSDNGTTTPADMAGGGTQNDMGTTPADMAGGETQTDMGGGTQADMAGGGTEDMASTQADMGGGAASADYCQEECSQDSDCTINGSDLNYTCDMASKRCAVEVDGCSLDSECQAQFSGWVTACTSADECFGQVCVDPDGDGSGLCATASGNGIDCSTFSQSEITVKDIDGADAVVCANTRASCNSDTNACELRCTEDAHCESDYRGNVCDTDTGQCKCNDDSNCTFDGFGTCGASSTCGCGSDADCADNPVGTKCYDTGFCGCAQDAECADSASGDVCNTDNGSCSCSSASACDMKTFDGTTPVCE